MLAWRLLAVVALAVILGFSGQSLGPHGTLQGHVFQCAGSSTPEIVDVWKYAGAGSNQQTGVAWQRVSDFGSYQFNLSPGDYLVGTDPAHETAVRVDANSVTIQDLDC